MKNCKRFAAMFLMVAMIFSTMAVSASASVWRTGDFTRSGWTTYHKVYFNNRNSESVVYLHTYACSKGTGHSGSCNNKTVPSGTVKVEIRDGDNNASLGTVSYNARSAYKISIQGFGSIKLRFGGTTKYQHWGIEGVSNVRSIA